MKIKNMNADIYILLFLVFTSYLIVDGDNEFFIKKLNAQPNATVQFQGIEQLYTTESIELSISIDPIEAIAGVQIDFFFNPSLLSLEWVAKGNVFSA